MWGEAHALGMPHLQIRMVFRNRFLYEDIYSGSSYDTIVDSIGKILLHDYGSAACIDHISRRLHHREFLGTQQIKGPFIQRGMDRNDI